MFVIDVVENLEFLEACCALCILHTKEQEMLEGNSSRVEDELRRTKQARRKKARLEFIIIVHMNTLNGS